MSVVLFYYWFTIFLVGGASIGKLWVAKSRILLLSVNDDRKNICTDREYNFLSVLNRQKNKLVPIGNIGFSVDGTATGELQFSCHPLPTV